MSWIIFSIPATNSILTLSMLLQWRRESKQYLSTVNLMSSCSLDPYFLWPLRHCPWARDDTSSFLVPHFLISFPTEVHSAERTWPSSLPCNCHCRTLFCVCTDPLGPASLPEAEEIWGVGVGHRRSSWVWGFSCEFSHRLVFQSSVDYLFSFFYLC